MGKGEIARYEESKICRLGKLPTSEIHFLSVVICTAVEPLVHVYNWHEDTKTINCKAIE